MELLQKRIKRFLDKCTDSTGTNTIEERKDYFEFHLNKIVEEAKKDIGNTKWLDELKEYVLKHCPKLEEDTPIFSGRYFTKKIDEHKEKIKRWFGEVEEKRENVKYFFG
jgi:hypothetical protein